MSSNIPRRAWRLLTHLANGGVDTDTNVQYAHVLGYSDRLVRLALAELTDAGYITIERFTVTADAPSGRRITVTDAGREQVQS